MAVDRACAAMTNAVRFAPMATRRALLLAGAGLVLAGSEASAGRWLPAPVLPDVPLVDQDGRSVQLRRELNESGGLVVVNFMFAGCQTVCPPQTALLRETVALWQARGLSAARLRVISLTVDPLADGPRQLRSFGERYALPMNAGARDAVWTLLTGRPADMSRVLAAFDVPSSAPGDHPSLLWLGDTVRRRWTRASSLNPPAALMAQLQELAG